MKPSVAFLLLMIGRFEKKKLKYRFFLRMLLNGKLTDDGCSWVNIPPPVSFPGAVMNVQPVQEKGGYLGCRVLH